MTDSFPNVSEYFDVIKSPSDNKDYRAFILNNGLKVLLSSDPNLEKCAASLSVAVGSMNDSPDLPGLAHLCEHMLCIDSTDDKETLMDGKGYSKLISENGGNSNAFTTRDQTNYHFDVASSAFEESITKFSKFFSTPPDFDKKVFQREINVIDSEHKNKLTNESWRKMAVEACTAKPNHPYGQFSTGSTDTLWTIPNTVGIDVLERLFAFHLKFYSSSIMSLVILAKASLDELEHLVVKLFSPIRNTGIDIPMWNENPFGAEECQKRIDIVPLADVRDLFVCFPIPDSRPWFKTFPHGYLSNLLGHKGPGSLFALLSRKGWVNDTFLHSSIPSRGFGYFSVGLQLTDKGQNFINEIIDYVFQYIRMLKRSGPQKYFWDELHDILEIQFRFLDHENPIEFVQRVSYLLHVYPMSDVMSVGYLLTEYNEQVLNKFLNSLDPEHCRVMTVNKSNDKIATMTEKWYGVKYEVTTIEESLIKLWKSSEISIELSLPQINSFIPSKFIIKPSMSAMRAITPKNIFEDNLGKVWFCQDVDLQTPKAFIRLEFFSHLPMVDPMNYNLNMVLSMMIKESLGEQLYGAILTGLNYTIKGTMYGIEMTVEGYDEKISHLVDTILDEFINYKLKKLKHLYEAKKGSYENGLANSDMQQPFAQIPYYLSMIMREKRFSNEDLLEDLQNMDLTMIESYHQLLLSKTKLEWLIYGNITETEALESSKKWHDKFKQRGTTSLIPCQSCRLREVSLPPGSFYYYKRELKNESQSSCCAVLYQIGQRNLKENVLLELLDQIIYEPCFNQLRNKEQLGYIVRTSIRKSNGTQGMLFIVQGLSTSPEMVNEHIQTFLDNFLNCQLKMSDDDFKKHKLAVLLRKKDNPKKLHVRANRLWNNEIYYREYNFNRVEQEDLFLSSVKKIQLLNFSNKYFGRNSEHRKCLAVYLKTSNNHHTTANHLQMKNLNDANEIQNITKWKHKMLLSALSLNIFM